MSFRENYQRNQIRRLRNRVSKLEGVYQDGIYYKLLTPKQVVFLIVGGFMGLIFLAKVFEG